MSNLVRGLVPYAPASIQPMSAIAYWLMFALIARFSSSTVLAHAVLGLAITTPVFVLLGFQLRTLAIVHGERAMGYRPALVRFRIILSTLAILVSFGIAVCLEGGASLIALTLSFAILKTIDAVADLSYAFNQVDSMHVLTLRSGIYKWGGLCASFALVIAATGNTLMALGLSAVVVTLAHVWIDVPRLRQPEPAAPRSPLTWRLLSTGLALGLSAFSLNAVSQAPKYGLAAYGAVEGLAQYGVVSQFITLSGVITDGLGPIVLGRLKDRGSHSPAQPIVVLATTVALLGLCAYAGGPEMITAVYGERYWPQEVSRLLLCVVTVSAAAAGVSKYILGLAERRGVYVPIGITVAVTVCAGIRLIPSGSVDAALLLLICANVAFTLSVLGVSRAAGRVHD